MLTTQQIGRPSGEGYDRISWSTSCSPGANCNECKRRLIRLIMDIHLYAPLTVDDSSLSSSSPPSTSTISYDRSIERVRQWISRGCITSLNYQICLISSALGHHGAMYQLSVLLACYFPFLCLRSVTIHTNDGVVQRGYTLSAVMSPSCNNHDQKIDRSRVFPRLIGLVRHLCDPSNKYDISHDDMSRHQMDNKRTLLYYWPFEYELMRYMASDPYYIDSIGHTPWSYRLYHIKDYWGGIDVKANLIEPSLERLRDAIKRYQSDMYTHLCHHTSIGQLLPSSIIEWIIIKTYLLPLREQADNNASNCPDCYPILDTSTPLKLLPTMKVLVN
jgi:hypothetical protein